MLENNIQPNRTWFIILSTFIILEYVRPQFYFPALGHFRLSMLLLIAMLAGLIYRGLLQSTLTNVFVRRYVIFVAYLWLSILYATNQFWAYKISFGMTINIITIFMIVVELKNKQLVKQFIIVFLFASATAALCAIFNSGKGPGGFLNDENDLAAAMVVALPFAYFLINVEKRAITKTLYISLFLLLVAGVVFSSSRGGFVGLISVTIAIIFTSKNKFRNVLAISILSLIVLVSLPKEYTDEMNTIQDAEDATRQGRLHSWGLGWDMFIANPVLGVGASNYPWTVAYYEQQSENYDETKRSLGGRQSHSLYFTLLPELGIVGVTLYLLIFLGIATALNNKRKRSRDFFISSCCSTLIASGIGFHVTAVFISVLYYPHAWHLLGMSIAVLNLEETESE